MTNQPLHGIHVRKLEIAGFRVIPGAKRGEPDLVFIEQFRTWMPVPQAIEHGWVVPPRIPEPHLIAPPLSPEEIRAKATALQPGPFKTKLLETIK